MLINGKNICPACFHQVSQAGPCPNCGYNGGTRPPMALPEGAVVGGKYLLGRVLGQGGFGITYAAWDLSRSQRVALKEFFPETLATREGATARVVPFSLSHAENYSFGLRQFIEEAGALSRFTRCPQIVSVYSCFEENGTAYFTMEYLEGCDLKDYIRSCGGRIGWDRAMDVIAPVMTALEEVHRAGMVHRDVTPDNIFITREGQVKLLDFGAARYSLGDKSATLDVVLKHGFAPMEQYAAHGRRGPYTDIYSLGATLYMALTGVIPPNALERMTEDELIAPSAMGIRLPPGAEQAILTALQIRAPQRYQTVEQFRAALRGQTVHIDPGPVPEPEKPAKPRKWLIGLLVGAVAALTVALVLILVLPGLLEGSGGTALPEEPEPGISTEHLVPTKPSAEPEEAPAEPEEEPAEPEEEPAEPEEEPAEPSEKPTEPSEKPTEPTERPTEPTVPTVQDLSWLEGSYTGQVEDGIPNGEGWIRWECGLWKGGFLDGYPSGSGTFYDNEGGEWTGGWSWGKVVLVYREGKAKSLRSGSYEGMLLSGSPSGYGTASYDLGGSFTGAFRAGHPQGYGTYTYYDRGALTGIFGWVENAHYSLDSSRKGTGLTYTGMTLDGMAFGFGMMELEQCGTFYGEFMEDSVCGKGGYYYRCPDRYTCLEGNDWYMVHDDYRYSNYYTGLKLDGKWQGFGIGIIESTGNYYVGEILDDYRDGYGRVFLKSGVEDGSLNGIYRNGKYIRKAD